MTIEKGQPWGTPIVVPLETRDVADDFQLSLGQPSDLHIVTSGDVCASLGHPRPVQVGEHRTVVQIDALDCMIHTDSREHRILAVSNVTIGRWVSPPWRHQRFVCVTNPGIYLGANIAPRAHPNDGYLDIVQIDPLMSWKQRFASRRRATTGTHVPHPHISIKRDTRVEFFRQDEREILKIDNQNIDHWERIVVKVLPDYWQVIV